MMLPFMGIIDAYGGYTAAYYNAMGFYLLSKQTVTHLYERSTDR